MATEEEATGRKASYLRYPGVWTMVAGLIQSAVGYGGPYYGWSVFVPTLIEEFGWSRTLMGLLASGGRFFGIVAFPLGGWSTDTFGPRWASIAWLNAMALGWFALIYVTEYWQLMLVYSILLYGPTAGGLYRVSWTAANRWWVDRRAMALGFISLGSVLGPVFMLAPLALMIEAYGWRTTALIAAAVTFVLCNGAAFLYPSHMPEHYGLFTDNRTPEERRRLAASGRRRPPSYGEWTPGQTLRTLSFWMLCLGGFWAAMAGGPIPLFQNLRMTAQGYSKVMAAAMYSFNRGMTWVGRGGVMLFGDWVAVRVPVRYSIGIAYLGRAVGNLFFALATKLWHYYAWAIVDGCFSGVATPYLGYIFGAYFGRASFGLIYGLRSSFSALGGIVSPPLVGYLSDMRAGDWVLPFALLTVGFLLAAASYSLATPPKRPEAEKQS